ncbi:MAG: ATP-binding protein [Saprospiraceae bacterium]
MIKYIFSLKFILFFCLNLLGQKQDVVINVQHFTQEDGLSNGGIYTVIEDSRGVIWAGTNNGLNRFDGQSFKIYTTENGLLQNNIDNLYQDGNIIWCIHRNQESVNLKKDFTLFDTQKEQVVLWEEYKKDLPFDKEDIAEFVPYTRNNIFMFRLEDSTYYANLPKKGLTKLPRIDKESFLPLPDGCLTWTINHDNPHIRKVDLNGNELYKIPLHLEHPKFLKNHFGFTYLGTNKQNEILLGCNFIDSYSLLLKINEKGKLTVTENYKKTLRALDIPPLGYLAEEAAFYFLPEFQAFAFLYKKTFLLITFEGKVIYKTEGDFSEKAKRILYKSQGSKTLWTNDSGQLSQIDLKQNHFINYTFPNASGFRGITPINNLLYFNHSNGILQLPLDNSDDISTFSNIAGLSNLNYNDNLIASSYGALTKYNLITKEVITENIQERANIWALYADNDNRIWYSENGIFNFNFEDKKIIEGEYNEFKELKNNTIYHFHKKENDHLWLCTTSGLYEWHPDKGVLARYWSGGKGEFYIPSDDIRHLYFDKKKQEYWLASRQDGLIRWQPNIEKSKVFKLNRLKSNTFHSVFADDYDYLWLSTENGIIQFDKTTGKYQVHLPKNGTLSSEYNRIAHFQAVDGTIYFGGNEGITKIQPKYFKYFRDIKNQAKVIVVELNQYLDKTNTIENLTADFYENNQIKLQSGDRFFSLTLAINQYRHSKNIYYLYKIKGNDEEWLTSKTNEISISGLPYGNQTLIIKASLENGAYSKVLEIPIKVLRPFYLTWWFVVLLLIFIVSSTFLIIQWRTKQLNEQKKTLQIEVEKRTQKIAVQTEELKALDKAKSTFFANVSHELRTPITLIKGPIKSLLKMDSLSHREIKLLSIAKQNTTNLLRLVNEILDLTKLENSKLTLEESPIILYKFLKRIIGSFQSVAEKKEIDLRLFYELEENLQIELDADKFEKIINNLLTNALKFTSKNGFVHLIIINKNEHIIIKVQDNGRGIPSEDVPNVFNRFYQSSKNTKAEGGLGIGLSLSITFAKLMKGNIWVESSTNKDNHGSTFYLSLPKTIATQKPIINEIIAPEKQLIVEQSQPIAPILPSVELPTILLVEDNLDLQEYIAFLLSPFYNIITAEHGEAALAYLNSATLNQSTFPSLIISDMMMPIMDGFVFLENVKANDKWRSIPVIMLTARAELTHRLKALRIGIDDYMVKPFDEEELLVRIENLLRNYEERQNYALTQLPLAVEQSVTKSKKAIQNTVVVTTTADEKWLKTIENIIINNIKNPQFSIDFIADKLAMNRIKFYKKIKQLTGLTPNQYTRIIRLKMAKDYLENKTYKTVKEVANEIGFQRVDYFSKLYKKEYGKMPSSYF